MPRRHPPDAQSAELRFSIPIRGAEASLNRCQVHSEAGFPRQPFSARRTPAFPDISGRATDRPHSKDPWPLEVPAGIRRSSRAPAPEGSYLTRTGTAGADGAGNERLAHLSRIHLVMAARVQSAELLNLAGARRALRRKFGR